MLRSTLKVLVIVCFLGAALAEPQRGCFRCASGEVITKCGDCKKCANTGSEQECQQCCSSCCSRGEVRNCQTETCRVCYNCGNGRNVTECADCGLCLSGSDRVDCERCCSACCAGYGIPHCMRKYCGIRSVEVSDPVLGILEVQEFLKK